MDDVVPFSEPEDDERLFYVLVQCIPAPILLKANSDSIIIPIIAKKNHEVKCLFKLIN